MRRTLGLLLPLFLLLGACGSSPAVSDPCAGATDAGARERFAFDQIVPCLNTVEKVSAFMANNITYYINYDTEQRGGNEYAPAATVYQRGIDDGDGVSILECYLLEENGWDAVVLGLGIETPSGSDACAVTQSDGTLTVLGAAGEIMGPFANLADAARHFVEIGWMPPGSTLRTIKASEVTAITTDDTNPSVLGLPWTIVPY
jgi:hypothetical protein